MKIKNPNYREFLDHGEINVLTENHILAAFKNIRAHHKEARALLVLLYYSGCRPSEALKCLAKDVTKEGHYIRVQLRPSKGGLPRPVYLKPNELTKQLFFYAASQFDDMFLFPHFKNEYTRQTLTSQGIMKSHTETTDLVRYHLQRWFKGVIKGSITPYFLRHNRFSKLAMAGVSMEEIRQMKGSRRIESVSHYIHMGAKTAQEIARKNN